MVNMMMINDDIPLKLGTRLPRDYEKKANIAEMEHIAKLWDDNDALRGPLKWVVNPSTPEGAIDPTIQQSDYDGAVTARLLRSTPLASVKRRNILRAIMMVECMGCGARSLAFAR